MAYFDPTDLKTSDGADAVATDINKLVDETSSAFQEVEQDLIDNINSAEQWAQNPVFTPISPDSYSSLHHANISKEYAIGTPVDDSGVPTGELSSKVSAAASQASRLASGVSEAASEVSRLASGVSETNAGNSETAAGLSQVAAALSETNAGNSETAAALSETNIAGSEAACLASEVAAELAKGLAVTAAVDAQAAEVGSTSQAQAAFTSALQAALSNSQAGSSATNAGLSETAAALSETNASASELNAGTSANAAAASAASISGDAVDAAASALEANNSAGAALVSKDAAATSQATASAASSIAVTSASNAESSALSASASETSAEAWAASALSAGLQNLDAIEKIVGASTSVVDVFIYDTSKDPDPLWRDRTEWTSWYQEPLGTATRGRTRKFPAVALIVAETDKVTIYDATDPDVPMWMVFEASIQGAAIFGGPNSNLTSVSMMYGILFTSSALSGALSHADFKLDETGVRITSDDRYYSRTIVDRGVLLPTAIDTNYWNGIVNRTVNDVAMTVLDGNDYPTIAVGTDGGVSVIDGPAGKGTVVDITWLNGGYVRSLSFLSDGSLAIHHTKAGNLEVFVHIWNTLPSVAPTPDWAYNKGDADRFYSIPTYSISADLQILAVTSGAEVPSVVEGAVGSVLGLTLLKENPMSPTDGMVNYITDEYQSGWMKGDIKMATLAETTEGIVGTDITTELVTNGDFDDSTGWTVVGSMSISAGAATSSGVGSGELQQHFTATYGVEYVAKVTIDTTSQVGALSWFQIRNNANTGSFAQVQLDSGVVKEYELRFTSLSATPMIRVYVNTNETLSVDNASIVEVTELVTNGTFDTDVTGWTSGNSGILTVDAGRLSIANVGTSSGYAHQSFSTVIGQVYTLSVDYIPGTSNNNLVRIGSTGAASADYLNAVGVAAGTRLYTFKATTVTTTVTLFTGNTPVAGETALFDNVTCIKINNLVSNSEFSRDSDWTLGTGVTISGGVMVSDGTNPSSGNVMSIVADVANKTVRFTYDLVSQTVGEISSNIVGFANSIELQSVPGTYTSIFTLDAGATGVAIYTTGSFAGSIDNIVVEEVTNVNGIWMTNGELVENGTFDGTTEGWSTANGIIESYEGTIKVTADGTTGNARAVSSPMILQAGIVYEFSMDFITGTTTNAYLRVSNDITGTTSLAQALITSGGQMVVTYRPTVTGTHYLVLLGSGVLDEYCFFDNVTVKAVQNIVENGEFSSDRTWTLGTGWTISGGTASCDGTQTLTTDLSQDTINDSTHYLITADITITAGTLGVYGNSETIKTGIAVSESLSLTFVSGVGSSLVFRGDATFVGSVDNVVVYELDVPDRSVNDNPLQVVGELTKTAVATGSELVSYSGFANDNYIEQTYNSDLDFGVGDFYVMGWVERTGVSTGYLLSRGTHTALALSLDSGAKLILWVAGVAVTSTTILPALEHTFFVAKRESGVGSIWINGKEDISGSLTGNASGSTPITLFGNYTAGSTAYSRSPLSLFRIGAGAPSADQIAYIYDTEKKLFEENIKCTLSGTSSSVGSLDYDKDTEKLLVGTDDTFSEFHGLVNSERDFSAMTIGTPVAIAATGGKVLAADDAGSFTWIAEVSLRDKLEDLRIATAKANVGLTSFVSAGVGQTLIEVPSGFEAVQVFDAGLLVAFTNSTDGFRRYVSITASTSDVTIMIRRI